MQNELYILQEQQAELMRRYAALRAENAILHQANEHQREELLRTHEELANLQREYKQIQTALALVSDSPQRALAKRKLTELIHLVDKALQNIVE